MARLGELLGPRGQDRTGTDSQGVFDASHWLCAFQFLLLGDRDEKG